MVIINDFYIFMGRAHQCNSVQLRIPLLHSQYNPIFVRLNLKKSTIKFTKINLT